MERQDEICDLISRETGKPPLEALTSEVLPIANLMDYFARRSAKMLRSERFPLDARGATLLTGGRRIESLSGYFIEPAVLVNVDQPRFPNAHR